MTAFERLLLRLQHLQHSIRFDWNDLEAAKLTPEELDRVREQIRGTRESMGELAARLDHHYGKTGE